MKKKLFYIYILFCVAMTLSAMAQGKVNVAVNGKLLNGTVSGGIKAAMNVSHFWGGKLPHGMRNGGVVGVWAEYRPANPKLSRWSVAPELVFSSQGGKFTINQALASFLSSQVQLKGIMENANHDIIVTENYVQLPIMLRYRLSPDFSVEAGPHVGVNVYSKARIDGLDALVEIDNRTHSVEVGFGAGATYYLTNYLMFNARYTAGLNRTFMDIGDHSGSVQLGMSFRF